MNRCRPSAFLFFESRFWVEMTRRRLAAYGHRAFNAGFPAMNPIGRLSQPDPLLTFKELTDLLQSCRSVCRGRHPVGAVLKVCHFGDPTFASTVSWPPRLLRLLPVRVVEPLPVWYVDVVKGGCVHPTAYDARAMHDALRNAAGTAPSAPARAGQSFLTDSRLEPPTFRSAIDQPVK